MHSRYLVLVVILVLGGLLRVSWLSAYPAGFTPDEAAYGYNAYSILKTGRDEWGTAWWQLPLTGMRSFGDYKLPLYAFLTVPSVAVFGLSEFAVRFPNAMAGTLAMGAVYLLAKKLFSPKVGIISAFILAVSPWGIQLSRGGFEANLVTLVLPLSLYLLLSKRYVLGALSLILCFYAYHSTRLLTLPFIVLAMVVNKQFIQHKVFWLILVIGILPGVLGIFMGPAASRATDVAIFSPTGGWEAVAGDRFDARIAGLPDVIARLFYNKATYVASQFIGSYLPYLSPQFLVISGPAEGTYGMMPGTGVIYLTEILFLGSFMVLIIKKGKMSTWAVIIAILMTIIPAAIAKGPGYAANRAAGMLPFLIIALAVGLEYLLAEAKKYTPVVVAVIILSYGFSGATFLEKYYYHSAKIIGRSMLVGMEEMVTRVSSLAIDYDQVWISRSLSEPHIYVAFYSRFDPGEYQKSSASWPHNVKFLDQYDGYWLGKYRFGDIHPEAQVSGRILYVGRPNEFSPNYPEHFHVNYLDGQTAIKVADNTL